MKTSKFTELQVAFILKRAEQGTPIAEVCRKAGDHADNLEHWIWKT